MIKNIKIKSFFLSLFLHICLFLIAVALGCFNPINIKNNDKNKNLIVTVYDTNAVKNSGIRSNNLNSGDIKSSMVMNEPSSTKDYLKNKEVSNQLEKDSTKNKIKNKSDVSNNGYSKNGNNKQEFSSSASSGGTNINNGTIKGGGNERVNGNGNANAKTNGSLGSERSLAPKVSPRLLNSISPDYPEDLREDDIQGSVTLKILVNKAGNVSSVEVISSSGYSQMDQAAVNAAKKYKFSPALDNNGNPVQCITKRRVIFELD